MAEQEPTPAAKPRWWTRKWAIGVAGVLVGAAMAQAGSGSGTTTSTAAPTPTPTVTVTAPAEPAPTVTQTVTAPPEKPAEKPAAAAATITENGTYLVGTEIAPGTYKSSGSDDICYWARLKGMGGDLGDIISNHLGDGNAVVTIKKTDKAFETRDCGEWKKVG